MRFVNEVKREVCKMSCTERPVREACDVRCKQGSVPESQQNLDQR
jgi:hypothetical protein